MPTLLFAERSRDARPWRHDTHRQWLSHAHPALTLEEDKITGTIEFQAAYDFKSNRFFILGAGVIAPKEALNLAGTFDIKIEPRTNTSISLH